MRMFPFYLGIILMAVAVAVFIALRRSPPSQSERPAKLQQGPIRHQKLSNELDARIRKFEPTFAEVYSRTHEEWLDGFQRDDNPESEVAIWEAIASAYQGFISSRALSLDAKREAFGLLLVRSAGDEQHALSGATLRHLSSADAEELLRFYTSTPHPILFEKH